MEHRSEVGSLSQGECLVGFEPGISQFLCNTTFIAFNTVNNQIQLIFFIVLIMFNAEEHWLLF